MQYTTPDAPLPGVSLWFRMDGGKSNHSIWVWIPTADELWIPDADQRKTLKSEGWEPVPVKDNHQSFLMLSGQFAPTVRIFKPGTSEFEVWAKAEDIQRAKAMPVILGMDFENISNETPTDDKQSPVMTIHVAETLPPSNYGTLALVKRGIGYQAYSIASLGEQGQAIQAQIGQALIALMQGGSWWLIDAELDTMIRVDGWEQVLDQRERQTIDATDKAQFDERFEQIKQLIKDRHRYRDWQDRLAYRRAHAQEWRDQWRVIQALAAELADLYWQHHKTQFNSKGPFTPLPAVPSLVSPSGIEIVTATPVQIILQAVGAKEKWKDDRDVPYIAINKGDTKSVIEVRPPVEGPPIDDKAKSILWKIQKELSDLDMDVMFCMMALELIHGYDKSGGNWITASRFLDTRCITPITHVNKVTQERERRGHRSEDIAAVSDSIRRLRSVWIQMETWLTSQKSTRQKRIMHEFKVHCALLTVDAFIDQHVLFEDQTTEPPQAVAWHYRMGNWMAPYTIENNRQLAHIAQTTLGYDPVHEKWEKRLARYWVIDLRMNRSKKGRKNRKVGELLDELSLTIDERHPTKTRKQFEDAMDRIKADGQIDDWRYAEAARLPHINWLESWKEWALIVTAKSMMKDPETEARNELAEASARELPPRKSTRGTTGKATPARRKHPPK